jgi:glucose dehydrogenase
MGDAEGFVSAFDIANGARRWRLNTRPENDRGEGGGAGVIVEGDTLFVATGLSEMLALSAADGSVKWRERLPAPMRGAPSFANGRLFVTTLDSQLLALSAEDGKLLWRYRAQAIQTVPLGLPPPAVSGDTVVAGFPSGEILAFRANDGRVIWSDSLAAAGGTSLADVGSVRAAPVISGGSVIGIGMGGVGLSIDLRAGRRIWEREFGGTEMPWAAGDWVFGTTDFGEMVALHRETGQARWAVSLRPPAQAGKPREAVQLSASIPRMARYFRASACQVRFRCQCLWWAGALFWRPMMAACSPLRAKAKAQPAYAAHHCHSGPAQCRQIHSVQSAGSAPYCFGA